MYSYLISSHKAEFRREEKNVDQKSLSLSALQINYINLDHSVKATERANFDHSKCSNFGVSQPTKKYFKKQIKVKGDNKFR